MADDRLDGVVAVVTGGASGIGACIAERFTALGAVVVVADRDPAGAEAVAATLSGAVGLALDVTDEDAVRTLADRVENEIGPIGIYCSNAGIGDAPGLGDDEQWQRAFNVHVLAHVYAGRHVLPRMVARGRGRFMVTASAAGLLAEMDSAPYSVTKHGSVAIAEWLAINHADSGVSFSCLCPQGVRTPMTARLPAHSSTAAAAAFLEPEEVADAVMAAFADGRFLILPHPDVASYEQRRAGDRDRWLAGMRKIRAGLHAQQGQ